MLLVLLVLVFTGCGGIVPSPGATEDDTTVSGQILMPYCCLLLEEMEKDVEISKYSGDYCYDETDAWRPAPEALVELRKFDNCTVKYHTTTDENGNYEFSDVKPGLYVLTTYCPTDEDYFLKDIIEKKEGIALDAGIPDCDSTSLAFVIEYIGDTYCHCKVVCPCFYERWSKEYKLVEKIATSKEVNMEVNIPAIIAHKDFGTLCNEDKQGNLIDDDLVDLVCAKLQSCCVSPGATGGGGGGETTTYNLTLLVNPEGAGTVTGAGNHNANSTANISASANEGWQFVNWTGDATGTNSSTSILMNSNKTATANFERINAALTVTKVATELSYDQVGDVIHYTITVENTGNVTLTNIEVTDPDADVDSITGSPIASLAPGDSAQVTAEHTITQDDLNAGSFTNTATATASDGTTNNGSETVDASQNAALTVTKVATELSYDEVGDVIPYTITVENTGNVTLTNIEVTDPDADVDSITGSPIASLAPGDSAQVTAEHTITQDDLNAGSFTNTATATASDGTTNNGSETVDASQNAALTVTKVATELSYDEVGDVIPYTITVENTGNVTLTNIEVSDPDADSITGSPIASLAPGASADVTATHTITQDDLDAGSFTNTATATASDGTTSNDSETVDASQNAALTVTKVATESSYDEVGDVIDYTITVENTGNVTLTNIVVSDPDADSITGSPIASLAPGASADVTATHTITQDDLDAGSFTNTATATASDGTTSNDSETVDALILVPILNPSDVDVVPGQDQIRFNVRDQFGNLVKNLNLNFNQWIVVITNSGADSTITMVTYGGQAIGPYDFQIRVNDIPTGTELRQVRITYLGYGYPLVVVDGITLQP